MPELFVTNANPHFTGVSASTANVLRQQISRYDLALVGHPLPGCPSPISIRDAHRAALVAPRGKPFAIWHVRRNPEMRRAIWLRDIRCAPIRIVFTSAAQRLHSAYPRWLISRMDAVIATTGKAAGFVPHVRSVVPHGVDTDVFTPAADRAAAWAALGYGGRYGIATVGRIRPEKGTHLFVDAMLHLLPDHPGAVALVVGRADDQHRGYLQRLQARATAAGLADRLLFIGEQPSEKMPRLIRALSLLMQLPRYEGYGMVPLEGLASGVPFVGPDAGYFRAFSAKGQIGSIVPRDADVAAAAAADWLSLDDYTSRMTTARHIVQTHFSAKTEAEGIAMVYDDVWGD